MLNAAHDLHAFLIAATRGICDEQEKVHVTVSEFNRVVTCVIQCDPKDLKFIYSKLNHIKTIAIAIAQRNKSLVDLFVKEDVGDYVQ